MYKTHWLLYEIHFDSSCIMILVSLNLHQGVHNNDGYTYEHITECVILTIGYHLLECMHYVHVLILYVFTVIKLCSFWFLVTCICPNLICTAEIIVEYSPERSIYRDYLP